MYIKDTYTGNVRKYGTNQHDSLRISNDGTCLTYEHLQCGDGSIEGDKENSGFLFCDDEGHTPEENEALCRFGADDFFNIGGWEEPPKWIPVSERLPEDRRPVLIYAWNVHHVIARYDSFRTENGTKKCWVTADAWNGNVEIKHEVIAWMPLPEPYNAESEG